MHRLSWISTLVMQPHAVRCAMAPMPCQARLLAVACQGLPGAMQRTAPGSMSRPDCYSAPLHGLGSSRLAAPLHSGTAAARPVRTHVAMAAKRSQDDSLAAVKKERMRGSSRDTQMPATTTTMVRSVWTRYLQAHGTPQQQQAEAAAAAAAAAALADAHPTRHASSSLGGSSASSSTSISANSSSSSSASSNGSASRRRSSSSGGDRSGHAVGVVALLRSALQLHEQQHASKGDAAETKRKVTWVGSAKEEDEGRQLYEAAQVGDAKVQPGCVVLLEPEDSQAADGDSAAGASEQHSRYVLGLMQCLWQDEEGDKMAQVRLLVHGSDTILGDAAADAELFVTDTFEEVCLSDVAGLAAAQQLEREFDHEQRLHHFKEDEALRQRNTDARAAGRPLEYFYRHLYLPQQGMFRALPRDLQLGSYHKGPDAPIALGLLRDDKGKTIGFVKNGVEYRLGDFVYVDPRVFGPAAAPKPTSRSRNKSTGSSGSTSNGNSMSSWVADDSLASGSSCWEAEEEEEEEEGSEGPSTASSRSSSRSKAAVQAGGLPKGSSRRPRPQVVPAWVVARLLQVVPPPAGPAGSLVPKQLVLQRYYRPEDVGQDTAYRAGFWDIYASPEPEQGSGDWVQTVGVQHVIRKCAARGAGQPVPHGAEEGLDCFEVRGTYDPCNSTVSAGPPAAFAAAAAAAAAASGGSEQQLQARPLATMDIFAGCGGLSEGMHQAGVADSRWAIEYEVPMAEAFQLNNPQASVFANDCNTILAAAMHKAGLADDCHACEAAVQAAAGLPPSHLAAVPKPGEVEFIMGGPPCQGFSGMNRHGDSDKSRGNNSMVVAFLSYADFYRPRFFLLENVSQMVRHKGSEPFRLVLRTLLDMGYQVRFGVLNAGHYGAPQSRRRAFIWAAAPDEVLPEWPQPVHALRSDLLNVNLPGGVAYCAVDTSLPPGAPLRTVTVRDAIADLPPIQNGHDLDVMDYAGPPESAWQAAIRGGAARLTDHITKKVVPLNLERFRLIPKGVPGGANWWALQAFVDEHPERELFEGEPLVPWALAGTAHKNSGWPHCYGRLDMAEVFPTSTTNAEPMRKMGRVLHPDQDRIVSVRERARSQGFADTFKFTGSLVKRHKQIGNAVPPPLAAALGRQLAAAVSKAEGAKQGVAAASPQL